MVAKSRFEIIFKQLYLADEQKIKSINSDIKVPSLFELKPLLNEQVIKSQSLVNVDSLQQLDVVPLVSNKTDLIVNEISDKLDFNVVYDKMQNCTLCSLCNFRQNVVIERGNRMAKVMILGDYPSMDDDLTGIPASGSNGELLDKMIQAMQLDIENDVYITNLIKCKPKANLQPAVEQINSCKAYLFSQIKHVKPQVIIALGRLVGQTLLNNQLSIKDMRGKINYYDNIPVIVSYAVDTINRAKFNEKQYFEYKKAIWQDLQLAMQIIGNR